MKALVEIPSNILAEEFLEAYPDALVIIHDRPVEGWLKSMENSITAAISWKIWPWIAWADPIIVGPWWNLFRVIDKVQVFQLPNQFHPGATDKRTLPALERLPLQPRRRH